MAMKVPEKYRLRDGALATTPRHGNNGAFEIVVNNSTRLYCIASDGMGWEHVSVHAYNLNNGNTRTPSWEHMCLVKDLFWDGEDTVVQYHPPKSEYVNNHAHTLHLWRPTGAEVPLPQSILVGIKELKPQDFT